MAHEVVWSPEALDDIDDIAAYIARDSVTYAEAVVDKVVEATRRLADHPRLGRIVPELEIDTVRECFVYSYRLIYRIGADTILVIAVLHGHRLLSAIDDRLGH